MKSENKINPTKMGLITYVIVSIVLTMAAIFAKHLAVLFKGPILCTYVAVLPKYIFGLGAVLTILEGAVYASGWTKNPLIFKTCLEGTQVAVLLLFILFVLPLSRHEGIPYGSTYNMLRVVFVLMLGVYLWGFIKDLIVIYKTRQ